MALSFGTRLVLPLLWAAVRCSSAASEVQQLPSVVQQAYLKASNTDPEDYFGDVSTVAISGDTLVVGAPYESSSATGINGNQNENTARHSGAAYVFVRTGTNWTQQAYLKASNTEQDDFFGSAVSISGDTIVIGASGEDSSATTVSGEEGDNSGPDSGAAYVFIRSGDNWVQQAYLKASNSDPLDYFGFAVAISGETIVIGAEGEDGGDTGVNGNADDDSAERAGAAYVFVRTGTNWTQQAYLKASNTDAGDDFGGKVAISGETIVVASDGEDSRAIGTNGNEADNTGPETGAVYVFVREGNTWTQQAYLKAASTGSDDDFGDPVAISGNTILIGAPGDDGYADGIPDSGAVHLFVRTGTNWTQETLLRASNAEAGENFGRSVSVHNDIVVIGAWREASDSRGVNGDQSSNRATHAGAAYVFTRAGTDWIQQAYLKASNAEAGDNFGASVALSGDTAMAGSYDESSNATGVNGNQENNSARSSGAVYVFTGLGPRGVESASSPSIKWPAIAQLVPLEHGMTVAGPWLPFAGVVKNSNGRQQASVSPASRTAFYRLGQSYGPRVTWLRLFRNLWHATGDRPSPRTVYRCIFARTG